MALRLYNTRTRAVEPFVPIERGKASVYVCGMTPSFHPHLGHARTFLTFDLLCRHLRAQGYAVTYVQNVTDIDDRIIDRSHIEGVPWTDVVARYLGEYEWCATRLGLAQPDVSPRATDEMHGIIAFVQELIDKGAAYETTDGVYFAVESFPSYGQLSRRNIDELRAGERIAVREEKRDPLDFALWKKAKPKEPTWPSPWGPGRPGWHIECSEMCRHYLGGQFDIHGGAADLVFPHHENEVAQTEKVTGLHPMANFWVHAGLLQVDGQKMSKSLGNFIPLKTFLEQHSAAAIRYLFLQTGYRKPSNFTPAALEAAAKGLRGLYSDLESLRSMASQHAASADAVNTPEFDAYLDDDLNTSGAVGWLQKTVRDKRLQAAQRSAAEQAAAAAETVAKADRCLAILGLPLTEHAAGLTAAPGTMALTESQRAALQALVDGSGGFELDDAKLIERVVARRNAERASKNFAESDKLRAELLKAGVVVRDSTSGTEWSFNGSS
ncbi:MAG: cysteine--tRNA ligase [Candidatus Eremiobacter antarcticus]|nr:cysteine--tRNA ligase [Candidatus Eremiobacteraeota bacterium]MBC5808649.1 cysteine--tRNA ligase [Candidatus Eremiobacteraeota bacterium]PZR62141.1 MAG: cysteine--tRNA ligase [Candidatus Eremiobacter sp. RRmetagenome_bin22]